MAVLAHCDRHEISALSRAVRPISFRADQVLCQVGAADDDVYLIRRGRVQVRVDSAAVATLDAGAMVGELGALGGGSRSADVVGVTDGEAYVLAAGDLRRLLGECPGLRKAVTPMIAARLDENDQRVR